MRLDAEICDGAFAAACEPPNGAVSVSEPACSGIEPSFRLTAWRELSKFSEILVGTMPRISNIADPA